MPAQTLLISLQVKMNWYLAMKSVPILYRNSYIDRLKRDTHEFQEVLLMFCSTRALKRSCLTGTETKSNCFFILGLLNKTLPKADRRHSAAHRSTKAVRWYAGVNCTCSSAVLFSRRSSRSQCSQLHLQRTYSMQDLQYTDPFDLHRSWTATS